jgi:hypothetical protein
MIQLASDGGSDTYRIRNVSTRSTEMSNSQATLLAILFDKHRLRLLLGVHRGLMHQERRNRFPCG